jgi:hypothetical protein
VFAIVVKQINVMVGEGGVQSRPHFTDEHAVPQSLRFTNLVKMASPMDLNATGFLRGGHLGGAIRMK